MLANLSCSNNDGVMLIINPQHNILGMTEMYLTLSPPNEILFENLLWFLANITENVKVKNYMSQNTQILNYVALWVQRGIKKQKVLDVAVWFVSNYT